MRDSVRGEITAGPWRWLLATLFPLGWAATYSHFEAFGLEYVLLTLLCTVASLWLLAALGGPIRTKLVGWSFTAVFLILYYLKFYVIVLYPELLMTVGCMGGLVGTFPPSIATLFSVYTTMTCGFIAFCITCRGFYITWIEDVGALGVDREGHTGPSERLVGPALIAIVLLAVRVSILYGFGYVFGAYADLPAHLAAINEFFLTGAICLLGLLIVDRARTLWWQFVGVGLLFARAALDMVLSTSKGGLAEMVLMLAALWLVKRKTIGGKQIALLGACLSVFVAVYPLMIGFRALRLRGIDLATAVKAAGDLREESFSVLIYSKPAPVMIFARLPGADALIALVDRGAQPLGTYSLDMWLGRAQHKDIVDYVSYEIFEFPVTLMPSILGEFYVIGGNVGVAIGVILFTFGALWVWWWLAKRRYLITHALQAFFASAVFGAMIQGGLDYNISRSWPLMVAAAILVEWTLRLSFQTFGGVRSRAPAVV